MSASGSRREKMNLGIQVMGKAKDLLLGLAVSKRSNEGRAGKKEDGYGDKAVGKTH